MSPSSTITSPELMPTRNSMRWSCEIVVVLSHPLLHRDGTGDRFDDARELDQDAVASSLENTTLVLGYLRLDQLPADGFQARQGAGLILTHKPAIPSDISREDRGEPTLDPFCFQRFLPERRPDFFNLLPWGQLIN